MGQLSTGLLLPEMKQFLFARTKGKPTEQRGTREDHESRCLSLTRETNHDSVVSPQTITGLLQEFDVQVSRGCGAPFLSTGPPIPVLSSHQCEVDHCLYVEPAENRE